MVAQHTTASALETLETSSSTESNMTGTTPVDPTALPASPDHAATRNLFAAAGFAPPPPASPKGKGKQGKGKDNTGAAAATPVPHTPPPRPAPTTGFASPPSKRPDTGGQWRATPFGTTMNADEVVQRLISLEHHFQRHEAQSHAVLMDHAVRIDASQEAREYDAGI